MSIEALLSEVTPFFYNTLALKAGVATNVGKPCSSGSSTEELKAVKVSQDKLAAGIEEIKSMLQKLSMGSAAPSTSKEPVKEEAAKEDEDFDLFDSDEDEEDEAKKKITEERLKAYHAKKATKPGPIAKSSIILDIKPWDDTTDLVKMEESVKSIEKDGLVWGGCKQIPLAYGIKKLQIICVIEDLKVSVDDLIEQITTDFEEYVQSVDIAAFNKI
ncbi:Elongation factor 1-beta [Strongyloides ratti]|uniref:Elongation factor 1-beta n=1 Tax=Strongyloides ratti TaxID=34506 RepID=A0A090KZC8_STRRB|nr:Elongation factor 1-beta [Strongyloides ratti]CEF61187.1 Elongation factor 1-beta [Strongyloides ratti]